jgi:hypothetical protein
MGMDNNIIRGRQRILANENAMGLVRLKLHTQTNPSD